MPACISPTVTAERCRSESSMFSSQSTTFGFARGLRSSETMLVSSKYTAVLQSDGIERRRRRPRGGAVRSARAKSVSSSAFNDGREIWQSRFHSCMGTSTAVSSPRRVTIWGPSRTHVSRSSLKRALASCTGQVLAFMENEHMTSRLTSQKASKRITADARKCAVHDHGSECCFISY
jgi:hypothetical protein